MKGLIVIVENYLSLHEKFDIDSIMDEIYDKK